MEQSKVQSSIAALLAIRVLALYLGVMVIAELPMIISIATESSQYYSSAYLWPYFLQLISALILWFLAPSLGRLLLGDSNSETSIPVPVAESAVRVLVILFGIYLLINALPNVVATIIRGLENTASIATMDSIFDRLMDDGLTRSQLAYAATQVIIGLMLIIGNAGFARFVQWFKNFGLDEKG